MAKLQVSECFVQNSLDAVRIFGAAGYAEETGLERDLRDSVGGVIFSGTNDIQRNIIAQQLASATETRPDRPCPDRSTPCIERAYQVELVLFRLRSDRGNIGCPCLRRTSIRRRPRLPRGRPGIPLPCSG